MATIPAGAAGDEYFIMAAGQWLTDNAITGATPIKAERKIYSSTNQDITPALSILEAALDVALAAQALEVTRETARALLVQAKDYLRTQLEAVSPANAAAQVAIIKPQIDGNVFLLRRMTRLVAVANTAYGWSLTLNPGAAPNHERYLQIFIQMVGLET